MPKTLKCFLMANKAFVLLTFCVVGWTFVATGSNTSGQTVTSNGLLLSTVPIGTVVPYAGTPIPPGWLECNGQAKNVS